MFESNEHCIDNSEAIYKSTIINNSVSVKEYKKNKLYVNLTT